jgi:8-oxo-dGTP diphosphatase
MTVESSLCVITDGDRILLLRKATGIGEGKWYPTGGKVRPGETHEAGLAREVHEETGLQVTNLRHHGEVTCYFGHDTSPMWVVQIFSTSNFRGSLEESGEGALRWFPISEIPYDEMWEDDRHWLPLLLKGKRFKGEFVYDEGGTELLEKAIGVE